MHLLCSPGLLRVRPRPLPRFHVGQPNSHCPHGRGDEYDHRLQHDHAVAPSSPPTLAFTFFSAGKDSSGSPQQGHVEGRKVKKGGTNGSYTDFGDSLTGKSARGKGSKRATEEGYTRSNRCIRRIVEDRGIDSG